MKTSWTVYYFITVTKYCQILCSECRELVLRRQQAYWTMCSRFIHIAWYLIVADWWQVVYKLTCNSLFSTQKKAPSSTKQWLWMHPFFVFFFESIEVAPTISTAGSWFQNLWHASPSDLPQWSIQDYIVNVEAVMTSCWHIKTIQKTCEFEHETSSVLTPQRKRKRDTKRDTNNNTKSCLWWIPSHLLLGNIS